MHSSTVTKDLLKETIDKVVDRTFSIDFTWDWPAGVAFFGVSKAWEVTGNTSYLEKLETWVTVYRNIGLPPLTVNTCSMGHSLLTLYGATKKQDYLDLAIENATYLQEKALRFGDRVLQHTVSTKNDFPEQAWVDTLFMAAFFLLRIGKLIDRKDWIEDALHQYYWHEELLQDQKTNLFYHGWDNLNKNHMSGIFWARGNAWAALTMAEALKLIDYTYPMFMQLDGALRDQLSALVRLQTDNGLWHTVLTDQTSYEEISASAGIGSALLRYGHPLHKSVAEKALQGVLAHIDEDGSVRDVSAGTAVMASAEDYKRVPKKRVQGWGQGLALVFLSYALMNISEEREL